MKSMRAIQKMLCLAVLLALCGCAVAEQPRVGISCPYAPDGWLAAAAWSAETTAEELGLNYMLKMAASAQEQADDLELMAEQDYRYIVLYPVDDAVETAAKCAMKAGATLLCFGSVPDGVEPDYSLVFEDAQFGECAAAHLGEALGGAGRVALVTLDSDAVSERRTEACRDALSEKYPGIEIIGEYAVNEADAETGMVLMSDLLAANPQLDGAFSCDAALAEGMLRAIEAQNRLGEGGVQALVCCGANRAFFDCVDAYADSISLAALTASPCALGELVRACDGLIQGGELEESAVLPVEAVEGTDAAGWLLRNGIAENAPF